MKLIDLSRKRFGRLVVIDRRENDDQGRPRWFCMCDCGQTHTVKGEHLRNGHVTSCGCYHKEVCRNATGVNAKNWKGGRTTDGHGYVRQYTGVKQRRPEHILIVENRLGRKLFPDELVHHKNGIRSDNRDDNLELRVKAKHPMGASVPDLLKWANEVIARYQSPHLSAVIGR
jgi:hypothetical protein